MTANYCRSCGFIKINITIVVAARLRVRFEFFENIEG